jgi:hypothetical protein
MPAKLMQTNASAAVHAQVNVRLLRFLKNKQFSFQKNRFLLQQKPVFLSGFKMIKKIRSSILKSFVSGGKVASLIAVCTAVGFAIVWPLWRFATGTPFLYTVTVLGVLGAFIIYRIMHAVRKTPWKTTVRILLHTAIIAGGICASVMLVFSGHRFGAIPVIIFIPVLYVICSYIFPR